ncbi:AraC family ligand binding domain-containing protein [Nonomuraea basaltis]|uniref:AraC family ligand binding domain-containing protein n=1 Tax=Nonomuraea basaltis TaxID=2495887 RepID=UPI00110C4CA1|nr:AraC family ligand binding domain-containing protein [Nonomuraea basaltis]TMR98308.1 hypothetical protein EJK15_13225 [Nonomuraea basaltis]
MQLVRDLNGMQLAVLRPASGGFPRHSHDEYVISTNLYGREAVRLDRASFDVDLDEVTVYNPGQVQCGPRPAGRRRPGTDRGTADAGPAPPARPSRRQVRPRDQ